MQAPERKHRDAEVRVILTTVDQQEKARSLAKQLLQLRLAACVQIEGPIESHFWWKGDMAQDLEWRLVMKTTPSATEALVTWLAAHHGYETPQIVILSASGSEGYEQWLRQETTRD